MSYTVISHDPFGRYEIVRRIVDDRHSNGCVNCGLQHIRNGKPTYTLFQYGTLADGVYTRPQFDNKSFCSIGCWREYTGQ